MAISTTEDDEQFAARYLKILDKSRQQRSLHYNTAQRALLAALTGRDLIVKPRQIGISTAIQSRLFRLEVTQPVSTLTLTHEDETTQKMRRMADYFYNHLPNDIRPARKYSNARLTTYPALDSEATIATAGNADTGRGGTYTHVHGSEVAYWKDAELLVAGAMQGGNPQIVLESSPNGAQGYFYNLCMEALDGNNDWYLHFFEWWIDETNALSLPDGEHASDFIRSYSDDERALVAAHNLTPEQIQWRRSKQRELKHLFPQEYPEDVRSCFLLSGAGYFGDLSHCYTAPFGATVQAGHRYVAGLDFAQTNDYTVLSILDASARVQVDMLRINRLAWAEMRRQIREKCQRWNVSVLRAEANSMGSTNIEAMMNEFHADGCQTNIMAFQTNHSSKASAAGDLHEALHNGGLLLLDNAEQRREMAAFQSRQTQTGIWQLSAPSGEHDDIVIANMLAWHGIANQRPEPELLVWN